MAEDTSESHEGGGGSLPSGHHGPEEGLKRRGTCWNECVSTKTEPQTPSQGKKAPRGALRSWGDEEEEGGGGAPGARGAPGDLRRG